MMPNYYSQQELDYIKANLHLSDRAIAEHLGRTKGGVRNKRQTFQKKYKKVLNCTEWNTEQIAQYKALWEQLTGDELAAHYGVNRRTINTINAHFNLYRRGPKQHSYPVGTVTTRKNKDRSFEWILTGKGWMLHHVYLWQQAGRDIPKKYVVCFADGDTTNCTLDNLCLKSRWQIALEATPDLIERRERTRLTRKLNGKDPETYHQEYLERKRLLQREYRARLRAKSSPKREVKQRERDEVKLQKKREQEAKRRAAAAERKAKKEQRERLKLERQQRRQERRKGIVNMEKAWAAQGAQNRKREKRFVIREVNLSEKVAVRINAKTVVYVNKGADIERIIAKYKQAS